MQIIVTNRSTVATDAEVSAAVSAINKQLQQHFNPAWDLLTSCAFVGSVIPDNPDGSPRRLMVVADTSDQVGALGYHTVDNKGAPVGFVFAKTTKDDGEDWRTTLSHEILEMAADPWLFSIAVHNTVVHGVRTQEFWPVEMCDAVQGESYLIDGIPVSNFVLPTFFNSGFSGKVDYLDLAKHAFVLTKGGYSAVMRNGKWSQIFGEHAPERAKNISAHSRRGRIIR